MLILSLATLLFVSAEASPADVVALESKTAVLAETVNSDQEQQLDRGEILVSSHFQNHILAAHMFGVVNAPPQKVWTILTDVNQWDSYEIPGLHLSRVIPNDRIDDLTPFNNRSSYKARSFVSKEIPLTPLERQPSKAWRANAFQYYDFPWPVSDRWVLLQISHDERQLKKGKFTARWILLKGNVKTVTGYFHITPFKDNPSRSLVSYHVDSDTGIPVPRFLIRYGANRVLPRVIHALRRESQK